MIPRVAASVQRLQCTNPYRRCHDHVVSYQAASGYLLLLHTCLVKVIYDHLKTLCQYLTRLC